MHPLFLCGKVSFAIFLHDIFISRDQHCTFYLKVEKRFRCILHVCFTNRISKTCELELYLDGSAYTLYI